MKCLIIDDEELIRSITENLVLKTPFLQLVKSCSGAMEAAQILMKEKIDLVFLDIEMPEMNGFDLIKIIPEPLPQIILITGHGKHAIEAFNFNVTDFLVKPVTHERFMKAVSKAKRISNEKFAGSKTDHDIFVRVATKLVKLNTSDVLYIEGLSDYVTIYTASAKYKVHSTMKGIETKLSPNFFMRIHKSFIVRLDRIANIEENRIHIGKAFIPISRPYKPELMKRLNII